MFKYLSDKSSVTHGFIPDMCRTVKKYNLQSILNNFFRDNSLPSLCSGKNSFRNAVRVRKQLLWDYRLSKKQDVAFFHLLHPFIHPCILYKISKTSSFRSTMNMVTSRLNKNYSPYWMRHTISGRAGPDSIWVYSNRRGEIAHKIRIIIEIW